MILQNGISLILREVINSKFWKDFYIFSDENLLPARLIPPWYLNEFHIHLWNYFFEIQTWKKLHLHHHMAIKVHISLSSFLFILISFCLRATLIILRYIVLENSKYNLLFKVEKEAALTQTLVRFSNAVQLNSCKCISKNIVVSDSIFDLLMIDVEKWYVNITQNQDSVLPKCKN